MKNISATRQFPILKEFADKIHGDINKCDFLVLYNEICQHLEGLHNLVNKYFPKDQCMMIQNRMWIKHPLKAQVRDQ